MSTQGWLWLVFAVLVAGALAIDLGMKSHRKRSTAVGWREAAHWVTVWVLLSIAFGGLIYWLLGRERMLEYLAGYLIEESLSVDNMFVFVLIFRFFQIPAHSQPRVLKYGILGAILMRFILIFSGIAVVRKFEWVFYLFGVFLIVTAVRMIMGGDEDVHPDQNVLLRVFKRFMPVTSKLHGQRFLVREGAVWVATPLLATLVVIEASDLLFAMDSIPAVLAISRHPFVVFTSNIFAILGLRALYFLVSGFMEVFRFLRYGVATILVLIGIKMLLANFYRIPVTWSLAAVVVCLGGSVILSLVFRE